MTDVSVSLVTKIYRYLWVSTWYAFAAVMVLLATGFAVARLLLPLAGQYNTEISEHFSQYLDQPVTVRALDAEWHGWGPSLVLRDVVLLDVVGEQRVVRLDKILLGLNLLASLHQWQLVFSHITLVGADLVLTRNSQGQFLVEGLAAQPSVIDRAESQRQGGAPFIAWLFSQGRLSLENSNISWRDEMDSGRHMHFSAVNLTLRNDGDRHQLDATVGLSRSSGKNLGKSLILRMDMWGDPLNIETRRTRVFVAGEQVQLAELLEPQRFAGVDVSIQNAGFQVWGEWRGGLLQQMIGNVDADGLVMHANAVDAPSVAPDASSTLTLDRMSGHFSWQRTDKGWVFEGDDLLLARQSRQWQPARLSLAVADLESERPIVDIAASYLQLEDISELLSLFAVGGEFVQQPLQAITPRGEITNAWLHWQAGKAAQYQAYAILRGASVNAWKNIPAADNAEGQLWLNADGGQVALQHAAVILNFPSLFRWPLPVDELRGHVSWQIADDQWRVSGRGLEASNTDIGVSAMLDVTKMAAHESPFMSLVVDFHDGDGSQIGRYLPTGMMSEGAVNWLDKAFVSARIVSGGAVFHGQLENFPFDKGEGRFEVAFRVDDASLNYAQDWPPVTDISAEVRFAGHGMSVDLQSGKIFSNQIRWAKIGIVDMAAKPMLLTVDGDIGGATQEKLDYLVASPVLYAAFGQHLQGISASGDSVLHLDLDMPIGSDDEVSVEGWVALSENSLSIPPLGRVLNEIDGRVQFFQNGLQADNIHAELLGQQTQISIATESLGTARKVRVKARGLFDASDLAAHYMPVLSDLLDGDGEWDVMLDVPLSRALDNQTGSQSATMSPATLHVQTNLQGVAARLPPPFDKKAEEVGSLALQLSFLPQQPPVMRMNYGGVVDAVFTINDENKSEDFHAELRFNAGVAVLPDRPGLRVLGQLEKLSLDEWRYLLPKQEQQRAEFGEETLEKHPLSMLTAMDIKVNLFEAYGQKLHDMHFKLARQGAALQAEIESKALKGRVTVPFDLQRKPISIELSYAYLTQLESGGGAIDPRDVPALDIHIDDFRYLKRQFGKLRLETARVTDGLRIKQLRLNPQSTEMTAQGGWYLRDEQQQSHLKMHLESSNIGRTLKALDYVGGIDKGKGKVDLELRWPGSFADVDASQVYGSLKLSLKDGYLLDVDPGAGRMFGMLSIQTLPRRLLLDFSDVFKKGFGFDRLKGNFSIEDGDAYTSNLYMDGPAARVDIAGRTGLAEQDYDQLVTVTPHVAETLPVIGILTATPQVGAIVLAIQKLFQPAIDEATKNQYTITGRWDAPVIKKLKASKPVDAVEEDL